MDAFSSWNNTGLESVGQPDWALLNSTLGGRLVQGMPLALQCFEDPSSSSCYAVQQGYTDEVFRSNHTGGYINAQWETCQSTGQSCLLDYTNTSALDMLDKQGCELGSVSQYYIDVHEASDISTAFAFSREHNVPIAVKNTGHDYKGRSSVPNSLGLWTHNLKDISYSTEFVPEGCNTSGYSAVTMSAGVQWNEAYSFAELNNITLAGGTDRSVGASGGWLMGGGHGLLSNTMGLGVDRVLEFKIVTPDGELRIANACQHQDLFYALRGGGGGTFGVVLESTSLAAPKITVQTYIVSFNASADPSLTKALWTLIVQNSERWASEGWNGVASDSATAWINHLLSAEDAAKSIAPLLEFGKQLQGRGDVGARVVATTFPSWGTFFSMFSSNFAALSGVPLALASRFINKNNFAPERQDELVSALLKTHETTRMTLLCAMPTYFQHDAGATSVTEHWRDSLMHVTAVSPWNWDATTDEIVEHYHTASAAVEALREITPTASYQNEADVYESDWKGIFVESFWGSNYDSLLRIKQKYDPDGLLDCWQCVGWKPESERFECYVEA
ncbi:FAD binding domain-containing protein [Cylindrobasidium torrendii FP15055 ss-10]|uniref:FAD binding domain-containing protein n=1 Tax=Cylindrobasidium torrendii FP15055 ss-10 TaxID=1314674 RepID=A0A0D7B9M2_9AGAR|nr:FAD binding domain-containing protein [Cylindrobasidium torrendii FP15055 ss-10]